MEITTSQVISHITKTPLLRSLLIISVLISVIFPLYSIFVIIPSFSRQLTQNTEDEAIRTASHLKTLVMRKNDLTKDSLSKELISEIETVKQDFVLEKLKIFSKQGEIIFSTDPKNIGEKNKHDYFYDIVSKGHVYTKTVHKHTPSLEGEILRSDVVETYVPISLNHGFLGAFEIYYDITSRKKNLDKLLVQIRMVLFSIASIFMIMVIFILFKAGKNILERDQAELNLQKFYENLENQIKDRTADLKNSNAELHKEIHERKKITHSLRESEERFRSISDSAQDAIMMMNHKGEISYWNKSAETIFQFTSSEALHKDLHDLLVPQKYHDRFKNGFSPFLQTGKGNAIGKILDLQAIRKNGQEFPVELSLSSVKIKGQWNAIGIIRDISARKKEEADKKQLESQLAQARKMEAIGVLAGGIAHDFNNILFPIMGHTEILLMDTPADSPSQASLKEIYTASLRAKDLVKQILTFSRQENSELKPMKIQPIVKEALKLIRSTISATIEIKQDISPECGLIKADPTQIHQILMNLATNAYHAMEEKNGQINVSLKEIELKPPDMIHPDMAPGTYACLTVSDAGIGMDTAVMEKMFDPFFTTKKQGKGTGMGLSVVHGIVKGMGGEIQILSTPGHGTEVIVYLPVAKNVSQGKSRQAEEIIQGGAEHILVVDDEKSIITMEKQLLERLGYQVTCHTSSLEALEAFRAQPDPFDLIITDMAMPNMTGDILSIELGKIRPGIPILLCTGFSKVMSEEKAAALGIRGFLFKPIEMKDLARKVREVLDTTANLAP